MLSDAFNPQGAQAALLFSSLIFGETNLSFRRQFGLWRFNQMLDGLEDILHFAIAFAFAPLQLIQSAGEFLVRG